MAGVIKAANTVFAVGFLFGTKGPAGNAGVTLTDDIPFAQLQEFQFDDDIGIKELMGPGQLTGVSVGISERKISGTSKFAAIRARQYLMLRGGAAPIFSGGVTTYDSLITDEPTPFNLHLKTPNDGSDVELIIYNCISPKLQTAFKLRDFVIPEFTLQAYGDPVTGRLIRVIYPGDQTSN